MVITKKSLSVYQVLDHVFNMKKCLSKNNQILNTCSKHTKHIRTFCKAGSILTAVKAGSQTDRKSYPDMCCLSSRANFL